MSALSTSAATGSSSHTPPRTSVRIPNTCSELQRGPGKRRRGTNAYQLLLLLITLLLSGCLPDPQRMQSERLLDDLVAARSALLAQQLEEPCARVGDVDTRLSGEPGLVDVPAWPALRNAAEALLAACGQSRLLAQPLESSTAVLSARARWQDGVSTQLATACRELNSAATTLGRSPAC
jgi:hypothetical protein